ncbi:PREDICTED: prominin-like protein isoform X1 [Rhagoletis zephyria]|uniref:prominin-like protein isoform X1 n=2 Tax=Rhagoletis TaxID=28609 RepID=UPI0008115104|nr:PREDICTED: prominin-like protein isoform X1 [Rhagoletis zephyria]XP_017473305.1 PREDICTED: prominin-like protein isoform X1 [Rhagoletis zephyria]XP_017473306.1 PREDICTED: prominin-like protein isoform X1 [Rhagoletis zephyria]XP_017473307.1 PREDICTED: prominin-like protein isoform X1 [Rhagoletis zephyria]
MYQKSTETTIKTTTLTTHALAMKMQIDSGESAAKQCRHTPTSSTTTTTTNTRCHISCWSTLIVALLAALSTFASQSQAFDLGNELNLKPTKYTEWTKNVTYVSSTAYNARGMQPLYDITHKVIWFFTGEHPLPEGYLVVKDNDIEFGPKVERNEWIDLIKHYWLIWLIVLLVGLLIVTMPVVGLCFCCCRCAGACGGRSEPFDKKHDTCRRVFLGFLLIALATGLLFGVIVTFATNSYMQQGIENSTNRVRDGSIDTRKFLEVTSEQIDHVLITNYKQLSIQLDNILRETSSFIIKELEQKSMAVSLIYLTDFLEKLPQLRLKLQKMKNITNELRVNASQLSDGLRGVKRDLLIMLTKCNNKACQDVLNKYEIGKLDANGIHYDQMVDRYFPKLPDVTKIIENLDNLISKDIASAGKRGRDMLSQMRAHLNETIGKYTPEVIKSINKAGNAFQHASNEIKMELNKLSLVIKDNTKKYTGVADDYLDEYGPYRFYFGIAVCSILLLILVCLVAALLCGICGKRPDGYGDDCCNKGSGSRFLMMAVALIFLFISLIALVALAHFLIGLIAYRGLCLPLKDPQNDEIFAQLDNSIDLNNVLYPPQNKGKLTSGGLPPLRISHVITACQRNQTIYEVLHIHNRIDIHEINDYPAQYKINQTLDDLVAGISFDDSDVLILSPEDKQRILSLGESALKNFDSAQYIDNLNDTITKYSLTEIAQQLSQTANKIENSDDMKDVRVSLRNQALHLETYEHNLAIPMKNQSVELIRLADDLDHSLRYKDHPFHESIPLLVNEIERAQTFFRVDGRQFVRATAENLTHYFASEIENYLRMVVQAVERKIGLCAPLANVYDSGIVALCSSVVNPLNGFWAGAALCVVLFLPTLMVAVKLASLYQKSDPYPGPLVESEYLYDAYSERDHIPLANGPKNKRRKNKDRRRGREYYEEPVASTAHGVPPTVGVRDTRYNDMAPKHWDGGPPRYQNPPMAPPASEYERPPPYYYPGATEQD